MRKNVVHRVIHFMNLKSFWIWSANLSPTHTNITDKSTYSTAHYLQRAKQHKTMNWRRCFPFILVDYGKSYHLLLLRVLISNNFPRKLTNYSARPRFSPSHSTPRLIVCSSQISHATLIQLDLYSPKVYSVLRERIMLPVSLFLWLRNNNLKAQERRYMQ